MLLHSRLKRDGKYSFTWNNLDSNHFSYSVLLPAWGYPIDETSLRTLMIITAIISIPFTLLAIFINDGNKVQHIKMTDNI
jgi:hypothetical protein